MKRIEAINTLRGIAAFLVALDHFALRLLNPAPDSQAFYIATFAGAFGVGVFFLISGFVIPLSLTDLSPKTFLWRRILRIYPVFVVCCSVKWAVMIFTGSAQFDMHFFKVFLLNISMFGGLRLSLAENIEPIIWTLAIEVKFYLLCALIYFLAKNNDKRLFHLIVGSSVLMTLCSFFLRDFAAPWRFDLCLALSSMPFMLIGVLISLYRLAKIDRNDLVFGLVCVTSAFLLVPMRWFVSVDKGIPTWGLATVVFLSVLTFASRLKIFRSKLGQSLGGVSYPMYAIHPAMAALVLTVFTNLNYFQKTLTFLLLTFLLSTAIHRLIELPSINFSKKSWGKRGCASAEGMPARSVV